MTAGSASIGASTACPRPIIVDRTGRIRYKHVGPLTEADIEQTILPLVARLEK